MNTPETTRCPEVPVGRPMIPRRLNVGSSSSMPSKSRTGRLHTSIIPDVPPSSKSSQLLTLPSQVLAMLNSDDQKLGFLKDHFTECHFTEFHFTEFHFAARRSAKPPSLQKNTLAPSSRSTTVRQK